MAENLDVITVGETMVLGVPPRPGRLRHAASLELKIGGAESNLAIAISRLGLSAGWAGYLGDDEPGQLVLDRIRAEGVDTSRVRRIEERPTGLYLREQIGTDVRVYYYRRGSAASTMHRGAFDPDYFSGARFVHLTGITPALSEGCRAFVLWAAREARASGARLSFDVNYRSKLWGTEEARDVRRGDPARRRPAPRRGRRGEGALGPRRRSTHTGARREGPGRGGAEAGRSG